MVEKVEEKKMKTRKEKVIKRVGCIILAAAFSFGSVPQFVNGSVVFASGNEAGVDSQNDGINTDESTPSAKEDTKADNVSDSENNATDSNENKDITKNELNSESNPSEEEKDKDDSNDSSEDEIKNDKTAPTVSLSSSNKNIATKDSNTICYINSEGKRDLIFDITEKDSGLSNITFSYGENKSFSYNVEFDKPTNSFSIKGDSANSFGAPTVEYNVTDSQNGIGTLTIKDIDKDMAGNISLTAKDLAGNESTALSFTLKYDSNVPSLAVKKNSDKDYWSTNSSDKPFYYKDSDIELTVFSEDKQSISDSETSGLKRVFYKLNSGNETDFTKKENTEKEYQATVTNLTENTLNKIAISPEDNAGNRLLLDDTDGTKGNIYYVYRDTKGPEISIDKYKEAKDIYFISDNDGYKTVDVSGKISDVSGIRSIKVTCDDKEIASWSISDDENNIEKTGKEISYSKEDESFTIKGLDEAGTYKIEAEDNVATKNDNEEGNKSEAKAFEIKKDSTAPSISNLKIKDTSNNNFISWAKNQFLGTKSIEVEFTASDKDSGIDKDSAFIRQADDTLHESDYKADSVTANGNSYTAYFSLKKGGEQKITFMIKDNVGNDSNSDVSGNATIDEEAPRIETTFGSNIIASDSKDNTSNNVDVYFDAESKDDISFKVSASDDYGLDTVTAKAINEEKINVKVSKEDDNAQNDDGNKEIKKSFESEEKSFTFPSDEKTATVIVEALDLVKDNTRESHISTKTYTIHKLTARANVENLKIDDTEIGGESDEYKFFKNDSAKITFSVSMNSDDGTKIPDGIKSISYTLNGKGNASSGEVQVNDTETYVIPISGSFSGNITIKVVDKFNREVSKTSENFVIENSETHNSEGKIDLTYPNQNGTSLDGIALFNNDTFVHAVVTDQFSGIKSVSYTVEAPYDTGKNGNFDLTVNPTQKDKNINTVAKADIPVSSNSNNIKVTVTLTDNAGNTSSKDITLGIDKTAPKIEVSYDNNSNVNGFYKADRIATVTVTERNFNKDNVTFDVKNEKGEIPEISGWTDSLNASDPDSSTHSCTVHFSKDGDYTFSLSLTDAVGNKAEDKESPFTIDKTAPVISVSLDSAGAKNNNFYNTKKTATIKIEEHNFDSSSVKINGRATDGTNEIGFPQTKGWIDSGDMHTAEIIFDTDGTYAFSVDCTDKAGNMGATAKQDIFNIDVTAPEISFSGILNQSANRGDIRPSISLSDKNYDRNSVSITLTGANNGEVDYPGTFVDSADGQTYTFENFKESEKVDDVYTLTATATDLAGNEFSDSLIFSVNRFGSVYTIESPAKENNGKYEKTPFDVVVKETNVDELSQDKTSVSVMKNDVPETLTSDEYAVASSGGGNLWHQYTYTLDRNLFKNDGTYSVAFYSVDMAGNINENINESKKAVIKFGIDGTSPIVTSENVEDGQFVNAVSFDALFNAKDNLVLSKVKAYVDDEEVPVKTEGDDTYLVTLQESTESQKVKVVATDAAGNSAYTEVKEIIVSTNAFLRFFYNKPLFYSVLALIFGVILLTIYLILRKKAHSNIE